MCRFVGFVAACFMVWTTVAVGSPGMPLIYMYDLPHELDGTVIRDDVRCESMQGEELDTCLFGRILNTSFGHFRDVSQFSAGRIFHALMQHYSWRTTNPDSADLFYIPFFFTNLPDQSRCPTPDALAKHLTHLNADTAPRHFLLSPRVAWSGDLCTDVFNSAQAPFSSVIKLALEERVCPRLKRSSFLERAQQGTRPRSPPAAVNLHSYPYPSMLSGLPDEQLSETQLALSKRSPRKVRISCLWGAHGAVGLRRTLADFCQQHQRCEFRAISPDARDKTNTEMIVATKRDAIFCIEPEGDSPSRKGMVDSVTLGCNPVVLNDMTQLWHWHVPDWDSISVLHGGKNVTALFQKLESMTDDEISKKQEKMAEWSARLNWPRIGTQRSGQFNGAVSILLHEMHQLSSAQTAATSHPLDDSDRSC